MNQYNFGAWACWGTLQYIFSLHESIKKYIVLVTI